MAKDNEKKPVAKKASSKKAPVKKAVSKKAPAKSVTSKTKSKKPVDKILVAIGIFVALTLIGIAISISMVLNQSQTAPIADNAVVSEVSIDDDAILGDPDAPITIVEFSDYGCPFCGRHFLQTMPSIKSEYIDKGLVKVVYRDFAFKGENSQQLAAAAECAGESNGDAGFYEIHDYIFRNQGMQAAQVVAHAQSLGYGAEFDNCFESGDMIDEVQADFEDAKAYGVNSTPTFFINGEKLVGAQPFEAFKQVIDSQLSELQ